MAFKEVKEDFNYPQREEEILSFWKKNGIFQKSIQIRKDAPLYVFYEGPPTANGLPGIHHVIARIIKDLVCRYKTMQGFRVDRKAGWDTHGLPVEIEVEKELKLDSKAKIEEYGIGKFNAKCRESVFRYKKDWDKLTERIAYWLDLDDAYMTCSNEYIESVWYILSQLFEKGLIYQGHKIIPYCPRCETPLSSHEVAQGYEEISDPSVFVKMELEDKSNTYFLVWTTTPWTLISNIALAVNPQLDYVKVEHKGENLIMARNSLHQVLGEDYKIVEEMKGKDLEKIRYKPLYNFIPVKKDEGYYVVLGDFVSLEDGTGIVHIAPAFGADDYEIGKKYSLKLLQPVDTSGKFTSEIKNWADMFIKDADPKIIQDLKDRKLLYKEEKYVHNYPFCWRCGSPLIYYARKSWYIQTTAFKDKMLANNHKINWYPPDIGQGRFGEWLENNVDWALSRERFWGTPLNLWICEKCTRIKSISSIEELRKLGQNVPEDLDLHKPMMDEISLVCEKCQGQMRRTPEVIDCWFDSGSMPYAQWHYPFENQENFKQHFPADFISEAVDQTRGWFYSLLAISTFLFDQPAYKNVIVIEFIQDKFGLKMSKSKGNAIDPWEVLNIQGADALRWYLLYSSHPWLPTKIDKEVITEVQRKFFSTLRNTYSFFALYANIDKFDPRKHHGELNPVSEIDRWLLSRLNTLVKNTTNSLNNYDITGAARLVQDFVIDDLSNWYVRRNRRRFWKSGEDEDKTSAYRLLYHTLLTVCQLIAPYTPFLAEEMYQELVAKIDKNAPASVHLTSFPQVKEAFVDQALEEKMGELKRIVSLGRAARNKAKIKIRQPLAEMWVVLPQIQKKESLEPMSQIIGEEMNVKRISFVSERIPTESSVKPNFSLLGPKFGEKAKLVAERLTNLTSSEIEKLKKEGNLVLTLEEQTFSVDLSEVEIKEKDQEGFATESDDSYQVALSTKLDRELENEGFARELVNKIQNMRKSAGFEVMDQIKIGMKTTPRVEEAVTAFEDYIKKETLAKSISFSLDSTDTSKEWNINGEKTQISVNRIKTIGGNK
ncbi:MAG: isoleucine--tRNA ligase [candidate division Zixibacteria bacterium]|nr:isoleucine--tRNA ligase [candidate division Zixibacteria bacterium]